MSDIYEFAIIALAAALLLLAIACDTRERDAAVVLQARCMAGYLYLGTAEARRRC